MLFTKNTINIFRNMKKQLTLILLLAVGFITIFAQQNTATQNLSAADFKKVIDTKKYLIVDVRTASEFNQGHIAGAINIDMSGSNFEELIKKATAKNKSIAIYCRSGRRSKAALPSIAALKLQIVELNNGVISWQQAGYTLTNGK